MVGAVWVGECRGWGGLGSLWGWGCLEELLITNKSLIVASSWSHLYLLFKDARSFEYKTIYWSYSLLPSHSTA